MSKIPKHPSTVIKQDFIAAEDITYQDVANGIGISESGLRGMLKGKQFISPINAVRMARFFDKPDSHFLVMQARYQSAVIAQKKSKDLRGITSLMELRAAVRRAGRKVVVRKKT